MRTIRIPPSHADFDFEGGEDRTPVGERDDRKVVVDVDDMVSMASDQAGSAVRALARSTVGRGTIVGHAIVSRLPAVPPRPDAFVRYLERALGMVLIATSRPSRSTPYSSALSLLTAWDPEDHRDLMDLLDTMDTP